MNKEDVGVVARHRGHCASDKCENRHLVPSYFHLIDKLRAVWSCSGSQIFLHLEMWGSAVDAAVTNGKALYQR